MPLALTLLQVVALSGISRSSIYAAIAAGELRGKKLGCLTVILVEDFRAWLDGLPDLKPRRRCAISPFSPDGSRSSRRWMGDLADTRDAWAGRIMKAWRQSIEQILETGRLLIAAKEALAHGEFLEMVERDLPFGERTAERLMEIGRDPRLANPTTWSHLPSSWRTLYELTRLGDDDFEAALVDTSVHPDMTVREAEALVAGTRSAAPPAVTFAATMPEAEPVETTLPTTEVTPPHSAPRGARAIMASRREPSKSLNFFPTPPWATRALFEHALAHLGVTGVARVWEPACGEGHIALVLLDYAFTSVVATDVFNYSRNGRSPPAWFGQRDFLDEAQETFDVDWVITNPPFGDTTERFVLRALGVAKVGVAMFVRLQWLETVGRYEAIFKDNPPTLIAFFAERVPICKGRWDPDGSSATAYIWLIWLRGRAPEAPFWIPPGCREQLTRSDDVVIFTRHPVDDGGSDETDEAAPLEPTAEMALASDDELTTGQQRPVETASATFSDGAQSTSGEGAAVPDSLASFTPSVASDAEATPSSELLVDTPLAARPAVSPDDDFEDIPTFLRAGHPDNAWAKRKEDGS